jgi:hypothetical protein
MAFCRFVNRPRLIFKYDSDVIIYSVIVGLIPIIIGIFTTKLVIGIICGFIIGYIFLKNYPKFAKNKTPGLMIHFFYDIGLNDPNKKNDTKKEKKIPPGFINEFNE